MAAMWHVAVLLLLLLRSEAPIVVAASHGTGSVGCTSGLIEFRCPDDTPQCCVWAGGVSVACCPTGTSCELTRGWCVPAIADGSSADGPPSSSSSAALPPPPPSNTNGPGGVRLSLPAAAAALSAGILATMALGALAAVAGYRCFHMSRRTRLLRQILTTAATRGDLQGEARQEDGEQRALVARDGVGEQSGDDDDNDDNDEDDAVLCVVCLARRRCAALLKCGHVCCCERCAARLAHCPVCRRRVTGVAPVSRAVLLPGGAGAATGVEADGVAVDVCLGDVAGSRRGHEDEDGDHGRELM